MNHVKPDISMNMDAPNGAGLVIFCVVNSCKKYLVLLNKWGRKKWSFPKGHADKRDVNLLKTALRETEEETGFTCNEIRLHSIESRSGPFGYVKYAIDRPTKKVPDGIKHIAFYLAEMDLINGQVPHAQLSSEHTRYEWVSIHDLRQMMPRYMQDLIECIDQMPI